MTILDEAIAELKQGATKLDLTRYNIGNTGAIALATALRTNETLEVLSLWQNNIDNAGAIALATTLATNTTLKILDLRFNNIGDDGTIALGKALEINTTLEGLTLAHNRFGDAGISALATALTTNTTLKSLYLLGNGIYDAGIFALATALETNETLTELFYSYEGISLAGDAACDRIRELLQRNRGLVEPRLLKQLATLRQQLTSNVVYQSDDPTQKYSAANKSKQPYFDVARLSRTLTNLHQNIERWAANGSPPRAEDIKKLRNDWLALVVKFHLRCVDTLYDTRPITNINSQVAAAEQCLAQMDVDSEGYKEACYQLGRYYYQRTSERFAAKDNKQAQAFAKTALNYLHVCKQDPNFKEAETQGLIYDDSELPSVITSLVSILLSPTAEISVKTSSKETVGSAQSNQVVKDFTTYMPDKENYDNALNLEVLHAKTVPAKINYNEAAILASLKNTVNAAKKIANLYRRRLQAKKAAPAAALGSLLKLLDMELASANTLAAQTSSLPSNAPAPSNSAPGFFKMSGSVSPQQMQQALKAVRDTFTGNRVEGNFADHVAVLKNTAVGKRLNFFIADGHAKVGNKKVETLEAFVEEVMKNNLRKTRLDKR